MRAAVTDLAGGGGQIETAEGAKPPLPPGYGPAASLESRGIGGPLSVSFLFSVHVFSAYSADDG